MHVPITDKLPTFALKTGFKQDRSNRIWKWQKCTDFCKHDSIKPV